ncbi:glutathione S-transferase, partial [Salmonella enterica subsp. enterica serovar Heidelberg]|nr:glutathione S-transferase [Salmonella enterica subsp. enterica serovar Heidelberg]
PWLRRDEFLDLNPTGQVPVMVDDERGVTLIDSQVICEFFEETVNKAPMLNGTATDRAEIRRLAIWFDTNFYAEITAPLLHERMLKRIVYKQSPDGQALR